MSFSQEYVGNCCGAWCVTRYLCIKKYNSWEKDESIFKIKGRTIWDSVKFKKGDGALPKWVSEEYSDPWKMIDVLETHAMKSGLCIEFAAEKTKDVQHQGLLSILKSLKSRKKKTISPGNISGLPKGGYAIAVMNDLKNLGLHFLLFNKPGKSAFFQLYDPRSDTLTWEDHSTFGYGKIVKNKPTIKGSVTSQQFEFLGVYIKIETT